MGKTGKWLKSIWAGGKKDHSKNKPTTNSVPLIKTSDNKNRNQNPTTPVAVIPRPATPTKDKKRWSFRRSSATSAASTPVAVEVVAAAAPPSATPPVQEVEEKTALVVAPAPLVPVADDGGEDNAAAEEAAALKIQSVFRSYLARKALKALRGLVKLQALVRGHLVRKQATATLRCMQALVTAQARARAQRIRSVEDGKIMMVNNHRHSTTHRRRSHDEKFKNPNYHDMDENVKIVEMDHAEYKSNIKSRSSYSNSMLSQQQQPMIDDRTDDKISTYYSSTKHPHTKQENYGQQISPAPSAMTDLSPRTCSGYFEDYAFATAQSSPQCYSSTSRLDPSSQAPLFAFPRPDYNYAETMSYEYPLCPSYMANTKSSQAKVRSQSAPKQRPEYDRQPSRGRRPSVEARGIPKGARMQRSSSQVGSTTSQSVQYPWSIKLDKSTVSLVDSECGSNYSILTTNGNNYCKSVVSYDPRY